MVISPSEQNKAGTEIGSAEEEDIISDLLNNNANNLCLHDEYNHS